MDIILFFLCYSPKIATLQLTQVPSSLSDRCTSRAGQMCEGGGGVTCSQTAAHEGTLYFDIHKIKPTFARFCIVEFRFLLKKYLDAIISKMSHKF